MDSEDEYIRGRVRHTVSNLSDEDLIRMLEGPPNEYTAFAMDVAQAELSRRGGKEVIEERIAEEAGYPRSQNPWNYLIWAIAATLCCFLPTGVVAIVYAVQARRQFERGNIDEGVESLQKSRRWCWASLIIAASLIIIEIAVVLLRWLLERNDPVASGRVLATIGC